jgi:exopolysaccharide biosynthesis polyprenyl glycosylphosphotransferase
MQRTAPAEMLILETSISLWRRLTKRLLDATLAALILLALLPLLAFCALAVWRSSPGPILFRQRRVGAGGREFTCFKFRTMRADADPALHRDYVTAFIAGEAERHEGAAVAVYKLVGDPRVTPAGRWLRRTSLDELPQLWNVLRGEMSLVGPRPPIPYEVARYRPEHLRRLAVKPGITGLWQVSGRNRTTFEEMVALDLAYIERSSFLFDLWILLRTLPVVFGYQGAH